MTTLSPSAASITCPQQGRVLELHKQSRLHRVVGLESRTKSKARNFRPLAFVEPKALSQLLAEIAEGQRPGSASDESSADGTLGWLSPGKQGLASLACD